MQYPTIDDVLRVKAQDPSFVPSQQTFNDIALEYGLNSHVTVQEAWQRVAENAKPASGVGHPNEDIGPVRTSPVVSAEPSPEPPKRTVVDKLKTWWMYNKNKVKPKLVLGGIAGGVAAVAYFGVKALGVGLALSAGVGVAVAGVVALGLLIFATRGPI